MKKVIVAGMIGNALEWYDYALYAHFVHIIGKHFLPDSEIRDIIAFAKFASLFLCVDNGIVAGDGANESPVCRPAGAARAGRGGDWLQEEGRGEADAGGRPGRPASTRAP